jgi:hypothetical protein
VFVALHESAHAQAANGIHTQESVSEGCAAQDTPEASVTPLKPSGSADVWNELEAMYLSLWHKRKVQLELRAAIVVASSAKVTVKLKRKPTKMISSAVTLLQSSVVIERRPVSVTSSQELLDKTISLVEHGHVRLDAAISVSTPVNVSPLVDLNPTSTRVTQELMASN